MRNLILGFLLLSCQPVPPGEEGQSMQGLQEQNGTRLRRMFWVASDGTQVSPGLGFYDSKLKQACQVQEHGGRWLCLPVPAPANLNPADYVSLEIRHD